MRTGVAEFRMLPLEVHAILEDVPLKDVTVVDLPGGGPGRTLSDVRALISTGELLGANPLARALFALRLWLGRVFGWDRPEHDDPRMSYLSRVTPAMRARSVVEPGTMERGFRLLFLLERESLAEIRNATVHAFLCAVLSEGPGGYRLHWAVYVKPSSWLTQCQSTLSAQAALPAKQEMHSMRRCVCFCPRLSLREHSTRSLRSVLMSGVTASGRRRNWWRLKSTPLS